MEKVVKIFGERNTGTNYLSKLIEHNFEEACFSGSVPKTFFFLLNKFLCQEYIKDLYFSCTFEQNLGWKHREIDKKFLNKLLYKFPHVKYILLVKNPYSWLKSLHNKPYHNFHKKQMSFDDFIVSPWKTVKRETYISEYRNPIEMWNMKVSSYFNLKNSGKDVIIIRYEDLVLNPIETLKNIGERMNLTQKRGIISNIFESTKDQDKNYTFYRDYYGKEVWRNDFSKEEFKIIQGFIDHEILELIDYKLQK